MAVDAQRRSAVADGRSIRSVLFRTMAESRDISACLHAIELLPRSSLVYPSWFSINFNDSYIISNRISLLNLLRSTSNSILSQVIYPLG